MSEYGKVTSIIHGYTITTDFCLEKNVFTEKEAQHYTLRVRLLSVPTSSCKVLFVSLGNQFCPKGQSTAMKRIKLTAFTGPSLKDTDQF